MKLTLHIGTQKTGSSALQSFFALNSDLLADYDILYPEHSSFSSAKIGEVSSGNLPSGANEWINYIEKLPKDESKHILFSNEVLFNHIFSSHENFISLHKKNDLTLIMYVRNPLDHLFSSYGQHIKRHGETRKISNWLHNFQYIDKVIKVIRLCKDNKLNLHLINYSKVDSIERSFFNVLLGNKCEQFLKKAQFTKTKTINRSLTRVEYEIQREFNKHIGANSFKFISDVLVNKTPEIKSEKEYIEMEAIKIFIDQYQEKVLFINTFLDKDKELELEIPQDIKPQGDTFEISSKQIAVLVESISQQILKPSNTILANNDADYLRDIALKFESKESLTIQDAHYLMGLAHKVRPGGPVIKAKLDNYNKLLGKDTYIKKIKKMIGNGEIAIIPIGFRCFTKQEIEKKIGLSQESLPFDSGFFSIESIVSILKNPKISISYPDNGVTHTVCKKYENYLHPQYGKCIKFIKSSYEEIDSLASSREQEDINNYLDSSYGYYTLDLQHQYILAHYNWHKFANKTLSNGVYNPKINIKLVNEKLQRRVDRMLDKCDKAKHIFFVYAEHQGYNYMFIDDMKYDLGNFQALENTVKNKFFYKDVHIVKLDEIEVKLAEISKENKG
ncbi:MAG: hypothetical protein U9N59_00710 [Campylobacterota bacterium]|nr:hypothetical protein [Campylobacterota bacterium]